MAWLHFPTGESGGLRKYIFKEDYELNCVFNTKAVHKKKKSYTETKHVTLVVMLAP